MTTPYLLVDRPKVAANIARLRARMDNLGVTLRPHLKTAKSVDVATMLFDGGVGPVTVSTLREAEVFAAAGFTDILYAVGIAPDKLPRVLELISRNVRLTLLLDSVAQAEAVTQAARRHHVTLQALIEVDCDGHRGGVKRGDAVIEEIADVLGDGLAGVLAHAGESYHASSAADLVAAAEHERATAVGIADDLRAVGHACSVVSVGSTPTAHAALDLTGVTEVRAGNFVFFDLFMAGLGVCTPDDIALSTVATVIGHHHDKGWILTDAGWMAMSRDRSTAKQSVDQYYGTVIAMDGTRWLDLVMADASQEHGILALRPGSSAELPDLPVGTKVRILPNHACATGGQHDEYQIHDGNPTAPTGAWSRIRGW